MRKSMVAFDRRHTRRAHSSVRGSSAGHFELPKSGHAWVIIDTYTYMIPSGKRGGEGRGGRLRFRGCVMYFVLLRDRTKRGSEKNM